MKLGIFLTFLLCSGFFLAVPAQARIGETTSTCVKRYGSPFDIKKNAKGQVVECKFNKGSFLVLAVFHEGKCCAMGYGSSKSDTLGTREELSDNQVSLLLKANGGGKKWTPKLTAWGKTWELENGTTANYNETHNLLMVATKGYFQRQEAEQKKKEEDDLEGF